MLDEATQQFAAVPAGEITLKVYRHRRLVYSTDLPYELKIDRQRMGDPEPYCRVASAGNERLIIAGVQEATVSREHARIERLPTGIICVTNGSDKRAISLDANNSVAPGHTCQVDLPALLNFGEKVIRLEQALPMDLSSLAQPTMAPGLGNSSLMRFQDLPSSGAGTGRRAERFRPCVGIDK